jgi:PAS domain S-box-containing protein
MHQKPTDAASEVKRLQRCMNDLVSVLALPAVWSGSQPSRIVETFLDALLGMLELDFVYARVRTDSSGAATEVFKGPERYEVVRQVLEQWFEHGGQPSPEAAVAQLGEPEISVFSMRLGQEGELGVIVAGSQRAGFPEETERLVLNVAANQAGIGLRQALLLSEEKRVASELDRRVAQRTTELATANEVLRMEIAERQRAEEEVKRSEARHRLVVETASDAVISIDEQGMITLANPATKSVFGYEPAGLIGKPLTVLMPESMRPLHQAGYTRYLETGERRLNWGGIEVTARRADGTEFPVEVSFGEMTAHEGKVFTGFIRDITEKKQAQEELRYTQAELARMMRVMAMGQLTASIAHEVSQPLSGILMNASTCLRMLSSQPPNLDGARETVRRTIRDSNRATDVITRLRTLFSRKQANIEPVDLNEAAQEVIVLLGGELKKNRVILQQHFSDALPRVMGDRVQLQQVILNLVRNASDAMVSVDDRPRRLTILTRVEGDDVHLHVQDSGVGFDPGTADQLFQSFFTTKQEGMGVGLSLSRSIVEAHRGRLWATRNEGPGATFAFSVPCNQEHPRVPEVS